jgi:hypothetical protein
MAPDTGDNNAGHRYHENTPNNSESSTTGPISDEPPDRQPRPRIPRQRTGGTAPCASRRKPASAPVLRDFRIGPIETVPMTPAEYETAVEALAVLIARWLREHPDDSA